MGYSLSQLKQAQSFVRAKDQLNRRNLKVSRSREEDGSGNYTGGFTYNLTETSGDDQTKILGPVPASMVKQIESGSGDDAQVRFVLDRDKYLTQGLGVAPPEKPYSEMLKSALDQGVDLRPLYGDRYSDAVQFKRDLGQFSGKDDSMIIPANPVGYQGGFKFDPNFGSEAYRQLAQAAGSRMGLSGEQVNQLGTKFFADQFYSGGKTKGVIGFKDFGKELIDTMAGAAGVPTESLGDLYSASSQMQKGFSEAASIESQSSGVIKSFGQALGSLPPLVTAGLNYATGGLWSLGTNIAQGDIEGAARAGLESYVNSQINSAIGETGGAVSDVLGDNWYSDYVSSGLTSGLESAVRGGDFGEGFVSGAAGVAGDQLGDWTKEGLSNFKDQISGAFDFDLDLPDFDLDIDLPDFDLPDFNGFNLPEFNLPDFKTPNFQGGNNMSFFSDLLTGDNLSALLNYKGSEEAIDRIRNLGQQGQSMFGNIAQGAGQGTEFTPYNITSSMGTSRFNENGGMLELDPLQQGIVNQAGGMAQNTLQSYNNPQLQQLSQQAFGDAQGLLSSGAGSTNDLATELYGLQQDVRQPGIDRQRLALEDRLRRQGRLGMTTAASGGSPEQLAFEKALLEQQAADQYNALTNAEGIATSRLNRGQGLFGVGTQATLLPEQINAQRASTGATLQGITQSPQQQLLQQLQLGGMLGGQRAGANLSRNQLVSNLLSKGAQYPLLAEDAAGQLELGQLQALSKGLTGDNPVGTMVNSGLSSIGSGLDGLLGGAVGGLLGGFFGGDDQQGSSGYFGGISTDGRLGLDFFSQ